MSEVESSPDHEIRGTSGKEIRLTSLSSCAG
jgi:hypothetical protein